ncbi:hypothetical protein [Clostridium estertheticum]|uniref:hypothetical protein n=1 Tax=Clostridium estertheticum TaxID=238834 RepID=UPI001CF13F07|nr:hypothetical protein [Clostridium estertheticum]MCB2357394.1 hypothetical protein [Clostridium estertheticum]WAG43879.1 hypothetical protein LL065_25625 [Clostridium estertheticum]WAG43925.1 hypothetical protein LL065_25875 [Clostridium estertheticum]
MNNDDIRDISSKRDGEIIKFKNYIESGKDMEDAVVNRIMKNIGKLETTLLDAKANFIPFNPNSTSIEEEKQTIIDKVSVNKSLTYDDRNEVESKNEENTKKKKIIKKEKINKKTMGVYISMELSKTLNKMVLLSGENENSVVSTLLGNMYNKETKQLNIKISQKEKKARITSFAINSDIVEVIENEAIKTGYKKTEIFEILIRKALEEYDI